MHRFFHQLYCKIQNRKVLFLILGIFGLVVLGYFSSKIKLEEDITKLIPSNEQSETLQKILKTVEFSDKIIVHISTEKSTETSSLVAYADDFLDSVQNNAGKYISKIQGKVGSKELLGMYGFVNEHLPLFLDANDYETISKRLQKDSISGRVEAGYKTLLSPAGWVVKKQIIQDPLQLSLLGLEKLKRLQVGSNFELYENYLVTKDHKHLLLFLDPAMPTNETEQNTVFVDGLKNTVDQLNKKYKYSDASIFGATIYAVANANQIKQDIQLTVSIAMGVLLLILIVFYRNVLVPLILFVPTIFGALLALAFLYFFEGQVSAVSLGIGSILLGITLDYSLHILTHSRNTTSIKQLFKDVGTPVLMSGLTTAVAFICLLFVKSEALKELGIFASISVMGAAIVALIVIPQLYKIKPVKKRVKKTFIDTIASYDFHKNKGLIGMLSLLFFGGIFFFNEVKFNHDISDLNFQPKELVQAEKELEEITNEGAKSIYMVSHGNNLNAALQANNNLFQRLKKAEENGTIKQFSSIGGIVLSTESQREKIAKWNEFWTADRKESLKTELTAQGLKMGYKKNAFQPFFDLLDKNFEPILFSDYKKVANFFMDEYVSESDEISTVVSVVKIVPEKAPDFMENFDDSENILAIDRKKMNESFLGSLKNDFNSLIAWSSVAVFLILLFAYRNLELSLLTFLPIVVTWTIVLAVMDVFNFSFNIFNIMICTFIFGLGVDYSIFMTKALRKKYEFGTDELSTFRSSIILSVITTLLGIGVLIFAKHPALKSIALVSILGIFSAAFVSFVLQPFLFQIFIIDRAKKGLSPLRLRQTLHSILSFLYFGLGAFLLSTFSAIFIPLVPVKKKKKMLFFHQVLSKFMKSVLYTNPFVKKRILNLHGENFNKQCIIIANHSSFLDILTVGMLHPKLIYLVNDWVYDSPVFGKAVKLAGFYPVSSGIEGGVEHLREKVRQGYSLIAFPEGSRSKTQKIRRFHKGAFYLSKELQLDILPVLIHGMAHVLPKGDFVIHDGEITVEILNRIPWNSEHFGTNYSAKAKNIGKYFRAEFEKLQHEIEGTDYYRQKLLANYRYKTCLREIKQTWETQKEHYSKISEFVDRNDNLLQFGSKNGLLGFYLCYKNPQAKITGFEENEENLQIARNCFSAERENIRFIDEVSLVDKKFNVLLISEKTEFPLKNQLDFIKLHVERIIVSKMDFDYQWLLDLDFEILYRQNNLLVLKKME